MTDPCAKPLYLLCFQPLPSNKGPSRVIKGPTRVQQGAIKGPTRGHQGAIKGPTGVRQGPNKGANKGANKGPSRVQLPTPAEGSSLRVPKGHQGGRAGQGRGRGWQKAGEAMAGQDRAQGGEGQGGAEPGAQGTITSRSCMEKNYWQYKWCSESNSFLWPSEFA